MWRRVAMRKQLCDFLLTRFDGAVYCVSANKRITTIDIKHPTLFCDKIYFARHAVRSYSLRARPVPVPTSRPRTRRVEEGENGKSTTKVLK
ncbi:hypothetical protein EVAR_20100_1 [Eumeta japonica]|uniref:Uncharacterized protein n=1 Tax=Eumeta variegata TaxID=151549 RepID=A0A4C1V297_EUMVA|nr:hypothetical protein EVAR_20100_1 [Eumeta japonica]